jgi:hypothetical protein
VDGPANPNRDNTAARFNPFAFRKIAITMEPIENKGVMGAFSGDSASQLQTIENKRLPVGFRWESWYTTLVCHAVTAHVILNLSSGFRLLCEFSSRC